MGHHVIQHYHHGNHLSLSPRYLDMRSEDEMEKKVESASVATALARYDLPVPGGWIT